MTMTRKVKLVGGLGSNVREHLADLGLGSDADFKLESKQAFNLRSGAKRTRWTYSINNAQWKGKVIATTKKGAGTRTLEVDVAFKDRSVRAARPATYIDFGGVA